MQFDQATAVQFSIFTLDDQLHAEQLFREAFGLLPDEVQVNRSPTPQKNFLTAATSIVDEETLSVRTSSGRIDFQIGPMEQSLDATRLPTVNASKSVEKLRDCLHKVDLKKGNFLRVAVNVSLTHAVGSVDEARDVFFQLTEYPKIVKDAREMTLQINKRKKISDVIEINRLVQYATAIFSMGQFQFNGSTVSPTSLIEVHASVIQLDYNTVPGKALISSDDILRVFDSVSDAVLHAILNPSMGVIFND